MTKNKLILIGFRATGKTTIAAELAKRLNCSAFDSDPMIEKRVQKSIAQIFADDGESAFRAWEAEVVFEILNRPEPLVLATGGGVPLRLETRKELQQSGVVVWLQASVETIYRRMFADVSTPDRRPALTDCSPKIEIETVLGRRSPIYQETASFSVATDDRTVAEIADEILEKLGDFPQSILKRS